MGEVEGSIERNRNVPRSCGGHIQKDEEELKYNPQLSDRLGDGLGKVGAHVKGLYGEAVTDQGHPKEKELRNYSLKQDVNDIEASCFESIFGECC